MIFIITFYVPIDFCEQVKQAMFTAGAGILGNYDQCCWQVLGEGQFRPRAGSTPAEGNIDVLSRLQEYRVEMLCQHQYVEKTIKAMKKAHPYEEVAYHVLSHNDKP